MKGEHTKPNTRRVNRYTASSGELEKRSFTHKNLNKSLCSGVISTLRKAFSKCPINAIFRSQNRNRTSNINGINAGTGSKQPFKLGCWAGLFGACIINYRELDSILVFSDNFSMRDIM